MPVDLPPPLDLYFASEKSDDTDVLARCFAIDATVCDEAQVHRGLAAIQAWKAAGKRKTAYTVAVRSKASQGSETIVSVEVAGNFPGSPVMLTYRFSIVDGLIDALAIGA